MQCKLRPVDKSFVDPVEGILSICVIAIIPELSQPRQRGAGVADVARRLATLDRGEDRLQHRAGIAVRPGVAPQLREVGSRAQFEQTRFLAAGDLNGFFETGFRTRPVRLRPPERNVPAKPMQIGEPVALPGLLDKGETFVQNGLGSGQISRGQQRLGEIAFENGVSGISTRSAQRVERGTKDRDVFLDRVTHGAGVGVVVAGEQTNLLYPFFGAIGREFGALTLQGPKITQHQLGPGLGGKCRGSDGGGVPVT